ncbi:hypothetical protein V2J09_000373 [Rumex salicifolius]
MISTKNLVKLVRRWRKIAVASRKRISLPRINSNKSSTAAAEKGQFVVYTIDERRYALPLAYLQSRVFSKQSQGTLCLTDIGFDARDGDKDKLIQSK